MAVPFLPQPVLRSPDNADLSRPLALLGDTIGQAYAGYKRQSLLGDVAAALKGGNHEAAAMRLIQGGDMQSGLALLKMKAEQDAGKEFGTAFGSIFGGGQPAQPSPAMGAPIQPAQPQGLLPPPPSNPTMQIGPQGAAPSAPQVEVVQPGQFNRIDALAQAPTDIPQTGNTAMPTIGPQEFQRAGVNQGANINGVPLGTALPALIRAATNPNAPKGTQELARAMLMKSIEQNPEITKLEIFQKRPDLLNTQLKLNQAGATVINTAEGMQAAQTKARIEADKPAVEDLSKKVIAGRAALPVLQRLVEINEKTPGGYAGTVSAAAAKAFSSLGLPVSEGMSNAELMVAMQRQFIPSVRDPGATSNMEQNMFAQAVPGLSQSHGGRLQIASMFRAQIERNSEMLKIYRNNIGSPDLDDKLAALDNKPMFTPQQRRALEAEVARLSGPKGANGTAKTGVRWTRE